MLDIRHLKDKGKYEHITKMYIAKGNVTKSTGLCLFRTGFDIGTS
jgi:hypothetical protein